MKPKLIAQYEIPRIEKLFRAMNRNHL